MKHIPNKILLILGLFGPILLTGTFALITTSKASIISPPVIDQEFEPGRVYEEEFSVYFSEQDPDTLYISVAKLLIKDETGNKDIEVPNQDEATLANWIDLGQTTITKPPGVEYENEDNRVDIPYTITIPTDTAGGSDYAVIIVSERAPESVKDGVTSEVSVNAEVTLQILALIQGERTVDADLIRFQTKDNKKIFSHLPVEFETLFKNGGNVHLIPGGEIDISLYGRKSKNLSLNTRELRVFPQKSRIYENTWSEENIEEMKPPGEIEAAHEEQPNGFIESLEYEIKHFRIGIYKAKLIGQMADSDITFESEITFLVFPWHILTVILLIISLIIAYHIWGRRRKKKG